MAYCMICGQKTSAFEGVMKEFDGKSLFLCKNCDSSFQQISEGGAKAYYSILQRVNQNGEDKSKGYLQNIASKCSVDMAEVQRIAEEQEQKRIGTAIGECFRINSSERKWAVVKNGLIQEFHNFDEILDYEVVENGRSLISGRAGAAAVGGLLFGATGAIVGSSMSKSNTEIISDLHIRICLDNLDDPQETVQIINSPVSKDSSEYMTATKICEKIVSVLDTIIKGGKRREESQNEKARAIYAFSVADEILKFNDLCEKGIITKEEFETQKKKLLELDY